MNSQYTTWERVSRARLTGVFGVYVAVGFGVLQAVDMLTGQLGLPDWVFPGALILLLIGLPVVPVVLAGSRAAGQSASRAAGQPGSRPVGQPRSRAAGQSLAW